MGILSILGKIAGAVTGLGGVLGKQQQGAAQGQVTQAQVNQAQDRNAVDLYQAQQTAQNQAGALDLQRKQNDAAHQGSQYQRALLAKLLGSYQPSSVSVPGITPATISGGFGASLKNPDILSLLNEIATTAHTNATTPLAYTGGNLVQAPRLTPLPQQSGGSKLLDTIARISQIAGPAMGMLPQKRPTQGPYSYDDNYEG